MSHFTTVELPVEMRDRECIVRAAKKLGCDVLENTKAVGWNGIEHRGELVLRHPESPYDVALNKNKRGAYEPVVDLFNDYIRQVYGTYENPLGNLVARYGAEKAKKVARALGHAVHETVDSKTGAITHRVVIAR